MVGNDQKGIVTTALPRTRDEQPTLAAIQDGLYLILNSTGLNAVDNIVADALDPDKSTAEKINTVVDEVYQGMTPTPVKGGSKLGAKGGGNPKGGTYVLKDEGNLVRRTGMSKDIKRRESEHARDPQTKDYNFEVQHRTDNYKEQRGLEHKLYEEHKNTASKENGGLNRQKAIRDDNPQKSEYVKAAEKYLKNHKQ